MAKMVRGKEPKFNNTGMKVDTNSGQTNLKSTSVTGSDEEVEGCVCIGRSCCPVPHMFFQYESGVKWNWYPDKATGAILVGDDATMQAYADTLPDV